MTNQAAVLTAAKAPLEVQEVETYTPGPHELLIKNEAIGFNPIEFKVAKQAIFPIKYPAIIGSSYGGTIQAVGSQVTGFKIGDKVGAAKKFSVVGNQYGSFQKFVVASEETVGKVPEGSSVEVLASFTGNLTTVVGLLTGRAGLDKPVLNGSPQEKGKKVLIYGGTSSVGSAAVQYVAQAGYTVVTTTSPAHKDHVSKLGAAKVVDHTHPKEDVIKALVAEGPYDLVVDAISTPAATAITGPVVVAQGGGKLYATLPAFGPETLPESVTRVFESWGSPLGEEKNAGLLEWAFHTYLPQSVANGKLIPLPIERVGGGLKGIDSALGRFEKGVSGVKLVSNPWE